MARSQNTFNKKEREKKKHQKRKEKEAKRLDKKDQEVNSSLDNMMVYLDTNGNFVSTPPDLTKTEVDETSIQISTPKSIPIDMDSERRGKVTFYNDQKGYGFIEQDGTQEKFFLHHSNLVDTVQEGNKVKFKIKKGDKGFDAIDVKVVK